MWESLGLFVSGFFLPGVKQKAHNNNREELEVLKAVKIATKKKANGKSHNILASKNLR